jgi:hypothetical protein
LGRIKQRNGWLLGAADSEYNVARVSCGSTASYFDPSEKAVSPLHLDQSILIFILLMLNGLPREFNHFIVLTYCSSSSVK